VVQELKALMTSVMQYIYIPLKKANSKVKLAMDGRIGNCWFFSTNTLHEKYEKVTNVHILQNRNVNGC
jgi:hypothetical protein